VTELLKQRKAVASRNLRRWWHAGNGRHLAAGATWYYQAHEFADALSSASGLSLAKVAGIIAVLSPSVRWERNKWETAGLCLTYAAGGDWRAVVLTTYGKQIAKAYGILGLDSDAEEDVRTLIGKGPKTLAFFANILRPDDPSAVTVDTHIINAAGLSGLSTGSNKVSAAMYRELVDVIRRIAASCGQSPLTVQATIWLAYKESFEAAPF
jgi:hypothetical protein